MDVPVMDKLEDVLSAVEYNGGGIEALLNGRVVKSVQRGEIDVNAGSYPNDTSISLSTINPAKAYAIVNAVRNGSVQYSAEALVSQLSAESLVVKCRSGQTSNAPIYVGWQVIEFY